MGVDGLEHGERLPACEGRARQAQKQGHFRLELARGKDDLVASGRWARIVVADDFEEGIEHGVFGGRRG